MNAEQPDSWQDDGADSRERRDFERTPLVFSDVNHESSRPGQWSKPSLPPRYEIQEEIGRGGMGVVYRAHHRDLDRAVVIKVSLPGAPVERFRREAKLLAQVQSPNVVTVHDFDVLADGSPMLVMEWVDGTDLSILIRQANGALVEQEVVPWMWDTSEGMLAAEEKGIVHRDLTPSNILIDSKRRARVTDFGLARTIIGLSDLSHPGTVMGKPLYMAPEQAEDPQNVDARADVYGFGATFYHALTGLPPFTGRTALAILFKHKTEPLIAPRARNPRLSQRTSELIERCLAKDPRDRFSSFAEIVRQLQPRADARSPWDSYDDPEIARYVDRYKARRDVCLSPGHEDGDLDHYRFPGGRLVRIVRGRIERQEVDAIVSSDDNHLTMGGGVSAAILSAAGPEMEREAGRYVPVRPGRAVVTSGGALPARFVFHGITLGFGVIPHRGTQCVDAGDYGTLAAYGVTPQHAPVFPSRDLISEIMASCFYQADTLNLRTIAFPLLGTGAGGFSKEVCLDTMFQFLVKSFVRGLTSVVEARIVLFDEVSEA